MSSESLQQRVARILARQQRHAAGRGVLERQHDDVGQHLAGELGVDVGNRRDGSRRGHDPEHLQSAQRVVAGQPSRRPAAVIVEAVERRPRRLHLGVIADERLIHHVARPQLRAAGERDDRGAGPPARAARLESAACDPRFGLGAWHTPTSTLRQPVGSLPAGREGPWKSIRACRVALLKGAEQLRSS